MKPPTDIDPCRAAMAVREALPEAGLFAGHNWRVSPAPFALEKGLTDELQTLGRVLLQFYRAANLLYRQSVDGKQPRWVAEWLDMGKPRAIVELQRSATFKLDVPRVIRPDILLTDHGPSITELDSVPGGIGLTAWLNLVYSEMGRQVLGGADGMFNGFASIFPASSSKVRIVVSEEAATYRPEMMWISGQLGSSRFEVVDSTFTGFTPGDAVYRFFELFDLPNVHNAQTIFDRANRKELFLTAPPKPALEEKMLFALLWNRNLRSFWRRELGEGFYRRLLKLTPYTWVVDPSPLPPHASVPELNITDWRQLSEFSQRERELILKVSGFSPEAWGARGVYLGSDLSHADWAASIERAMGSFHASPSVLQRYHKPALVDAEWFDFEKNEVVPMKGRARLCPYYFVKGEADAARAELAGVLATICPANKKIIHGMTEAVFAPCSQCIV